jgi:ribosomal protein S18 acetylase RimI-like enzyme
VDDLARFLAFQRRLLAGMSTRVEPFARGTAFFDDAYPERFISNFLMFDPDQPDLTAEEVIEAGDQILGGNGLPHRLLLIDGEQDGDRLAPALRANDFVAEAAVQMVLRRPPDRPADLVAEECSFAESRPLTEELYRREADIPAELISRFADQHEAWERRIGARRFVVRLDGVLAGQCELYIDGADAQVEFVDTLEEFRGRGVARAVVLDAAQAAREAGADRIFIEAADDDWPKELYGRLGFEAMARRWEFTRRPDA